MPPKYECEEALLLPVNSSMNPFPVLHWLFVLLMWCGVHLETLRNSFTVSTRYVHLLDDQLSSAFCKYSFTLSSSSFYRPINLTIYSFCLYFIE